MVDQWMVAGSEPCDPPCFAGPSFRRHFARILANACHHWAVALEAVQLLRLPGRCVALVDSQVAEVGERMNELRRLDRPHAEDRQRSALRSSRSAPDPGED